MVWSSILRKREICNFKLAKKDGGEIDCLVVFSLSIKRSEEWSCNEESSVKIWREDELEEDSSVRVFDVDKNTTVSKLESPPFINLE